MNSDAIGLVPKGVGESILHETLGANSAVSITTLQAALRIVGIVEEYETLKAYRDLFAWKVGGSESYVAAGEVRVSSGGKSRSRKFLAKAAVTFATSPSESCEKWMRRMSTLGVLGVDCPKAYSIMRGALYQEYIESNLIDIWVAAGETARSMIRRQLAAIAGKLDAAGFHALTYLTDLRMSGERVVMVDVGEDLGEGDFDNPGSRSWEELKGSQYWNAEIEIETRQIYRDAFNQVRHIGPATGGK